MTETREDIKQTNALSPEDYTKAMNMVGQNLLNALVQAMQNVPTPLRSNELVMQGLAAFLSNVLYKQFPQNKEARQQGLEHFTKLVAAHLANIS